MKVFKHVIAKGDIIDIALSHGCVCVLLPVSCCVSSSFPQYQHMGV